MFVIMGATGHVGAATAAALLGRGQPVTALTRDPAKAGRLKAMGAAVAQADINDAASLRAAFGLGQRAFLLNPPADTGGDTDAEERRTVGLILAALEGSGLQKVVAASTAGAQAGERLGDLNTLWELEEGLRRQSIPAAINRGGYYMSNWDAFVAPARDNGQLPSMLPADLKLPMAAAEDLGRAAADRLMSPIDDVGVRHVEGPERYSAQDVAAAFAQALGRPITMAQTPRGEWEEAFRELGFSPAAAASYARMTAATAEGGFSPPAEAIRGIITLQHYVDRLVARS